MKVRELIELLEEEDPEAEVVLSRDSEGNDYSPVAEVDDGVYEAETTWNGQFYSNPGEDMDAAQEADWHEVRENPQALCLWPTN